MTENNTNLKDEPTEKIENKKTSQKHHDEPAPSSDTKPQKRPNPTRYGDWERNGRCIDF